MILPFMISISEPYGFGPPRLVGTFEKKENAEHWLEKNSFAKVGSEEDLRWHKGELDIARIVKLFYKPRHPESEIYIMLIRIVPDPHFRSCGPFRRRAIEDSLNVCGFQRSPIIELPRRRYRTDGQSAYIVQLEKP